MTPALGCPTFQSNGHARMSKDYDPQMHTAEHILNRTMVSMFGCGRSFSSHLNPGKSKCDYHFPRPLSDAEAQEVERRVNEQISRHMPVSEEMMPRSAAAALVDVSRLPAGVAPDAQIRIVRVGDYDICACIGAHVKNTSEIGRFRLVSHDFTPNADGGGILRIRFKAS